jgi:alpha-glucosidase
MTGSPWWQAGVIYQIYPRSFQDSNADGIGDLDGITARLEYLVALGVDAIWISPIYPSPMADFGYDIADYVGIDPGFGDLAAFDRLIAAAHGRALRVILDYVPNHTSDRHPWFEESRADRRNARRDWYIWRDPAPDGGPPNNWLSEFGGPAWSFDQRTGQYWYHAYLPEQPDLNWRNRDVVDAMLEVLRFWLDRGVDGFRVDAIHHLIEDAALRDNPENPHWRPRMGPAKRHLRIHTVDQPEVHDAVADMRRVTDAYAERVLIGEAYLPIERLMRYYGRDLAGFQLPFNFHLITTRFAPDAIGRLIQDYEAALPDRAWPNWVLGNHDRSRLATRLGVDNARLAAMLLLTLRGTPTLYQGDEIGMTDVPIPPDQVQDPWERNVPGLGLGRDPVRTPMQWDGTPHAGFSGGVHTWLPLAADWPETNVAAQQADPRSLLNLYRGLLALRRAHPALAVGEITDVQWSDAVLQYERRLGPARLRVVLNFSDAIQEAGIGNAPPLLQTWPADLAAPHGLPPQAGCVFDLAAAP